MELERWNAPIIDELDAIACRSPNDRTDEEEYSHVVHDLHSLIDVAARRRYHTGQLEEFLYLSFRTHDRALIRTWMPTLSALTMLNHAATVAIALLPARDDRARTATTRHQDGQNRVRRVEGAPAGGAFFYVRGDRRGAATWL